MLTLTRQTRNRPAMLVVTELMILSALLPVYGAWLNPDFAGHIPQHDHFHFGEYDPHHHHSHGAQSGGRSRESHREPALEQYASLLSSIVNLPDLDAAVQGLVLLVRTAGLPAFHRTDSLLSSVGDAILDIRGITIAPLDTPPRL